jgi:hypothetical protein
MLAVRDNLLEDSHAWPHVNTEMTLDVDCILPLAGSQIWPHENILIIKSQACLFVPYRVIYPPLENTR